MFYTYVLKSLKDNKHYIGYTKDVKKRLSQHNKGDCISTRNRRPFKLIYQEEFEDREEAMKREKFFKTGTGREYLKDKLKE